MCAHMTLSPSFTKKQRKIVDRTLISCIKDYTNANDDVVSSITPQESREISTPSPHAGWLAGYWNSNDNHFVTIRLDCLYM
jgi:hypothetical protein